MKQPVHRMGKQAWWLLAISGVFSLSVGLSNTFVNVYLWKIDKSFASIGWYNLFVYTVLPLTFIAAGHLSRKYHSVWSMRIGIALHAGFYLLTLLGGAQVAKLPVLLGAVLGMAAGFYWFAFNTLSFGFTGSGERERFYGLNGVMGAVAGMFAPPVAGFLIGYEDRFGGVSGYHLIFSLSLALFVMAVWFSWRLKGERTQGNLHLFKAASALKIRPWRNILLGCSVYGLREGVFLFLIGLLVYIATGSELRLGEFVLLQSALSFASFFFVGRLCKPNNRMRVMAAGGLALACAATLFLLPLSAKVMIWYGSLAALALPLFLLPVQGLVFDGISKLDAQNQDYMEHVIIREIFQNAGRVAGIAVFLWLASNSMDTRRLTGFAMALGCVQLVKWGLMELGKSDRFVQGMKRVSELIPGHLGTERLETAVRKRRVQP